MTIFTIKIIACITMFLDHIKYAIPATENFLTMYLGRLSFPLFAFSITEGYLHTSNLKKYYKRLIIFGIISQIPFLYFRTLVGEWKMLNIMFTLMFGLMCINVYDKIEKKYISIPIVIAIIIFGDLLNVDYGWLGILAVFFIYLFRDKRQFLPLIYGIILFVYYYCAVGKDIFIVQNLLSIVFACMSMFIIIAYNGKQGKKLKYFFYWFYPIHLIIIDLISLVAL